MSVKFVKQPKYKVIDKTKELSQDSIKKIIQKLNLSTTNFKSKLQKLYDKSNPDSLVSLFGDGDVVVSVGKDKKTGGYLLNFSNLGNIDGVSIDKVKGSPEVVRKMSTGTASDSGSGKIKNDKSVVDKSLEKAEKLLKDKSKAPKGFVPYKNIKLDFKGEISRANFAIAGETLLQQSRTFQNIVYNAIIRFIKKELITKIYSLFEESGHNVFVKNSGSVNIVLSGGAKAGAIGEGESTYLGYTFLPKVVNEFGERIPSNDYDFWKSVFEGSIEKKFKGFEITNNMQVFFYSDILNKNEIREIRGFSDDALEGFKEYLRRGGSPD